MHRHKLVCMRSAMKNQLQAIALNRGVQKHKRLWSAEGREQLRTFPLPPWTRRRCDELLRLHEQWDQEIAELDKVVLQQAHAHPEANYLMQKVCGVGPITAMAVVLTLGPVSRFKNARKVASYAGLVPSEYSSGPHQRLERRGKSIAKVAVARKLLTRLYWLLRLRSEKAKAR